MYLEFSEKETGSTMRFKFKNNFVAWGVTAFCVIVASLLVLAMLLNYKDIASAIGNFFSAIQPIFIGFIIAYLMSPVVTFFETRTFKGLFKSKNKECTASFTEKDFGENGEAVAEYKHLTVYVKNKPRRILSIVVAFVIFVGIIVGICFAIVPQLADTITLLVDRIPQYGREMTKWVEDTFTAYPEVGDWIKGIIAEASDGLKSFLTNSILPQMMDYLGFLTNGLMSIVGILLNIVFGLVVSIYCLYSKELFSAQAKKLVYCIASVKHANGFINSLRKIHKSFGNFITGTLIDSFVVACITFIATTIFQVPFALLVSVIMGITNIIPYFGPFIGIVPCIALIFMEDPVMCLVFLAIALVIQNFNGNVISPRILGESMGLSSFWVVFAILAGQGIFGFWGLIIGIPLFAVIYSAVRALVASRLRKKGLPSASDSYTDIASISEDDHTPVSLSLLQRAEQAEKELKERLEEEKRNKERQEKKKAVREKISGFTKRNKEEKK